jgi:hypothetical protein
MEETKQTKIPFYYRFLTCFAPFRQSHGWHYGSMHHKHSKRDNAWDIETKKKRDKSKNRGGHNRPSSLKAWKKDANRYWRIMTRDMLYHERYDDMYQNDHKQFQDPWEWD